MCSEMKSLAMWGLSCFFTHLCKIQGNTNWDNEILLLQAIGIQSNRIHMLKFLKQTRKLKKIYSNTSITIYCVFHPNDVFLDKQELKLPSALQHCLQPLLLIFWLFDLLIVFIQADLFKCFFFSGKNMYLKSFKMLNQDN